MTDGSETLAGGELLQSLGIPQTARRLRERSDPAPGMVSFAERALLLELVRRTWQGAGAVIDGGSFFGSSVASLAEGVRELGPPADASWSTFPDGRPIHAYELGYLPAPPNPAVDRRRVFGGVEYFLGDSFVPLLEQTVEPYRDLVSLHVGDLLEERWPREAPVEIAFIDVCKTIRLNAHVAREFYPALIPHGSTLINQDFFFDRLPWIKVTMGYLRDYFRWEGRVVSSSVYSTLAPVPADVAAVDPFTEGTADECLALHEAAEQPGLDRTVDYRMALSRAYLLALKGRKDDALDSLRSTAATYADLLGDTDRDRGHQFRFDRAERQITNGTIFKVS